MNVTTSQADGLFLLEFSILMVPGAVQRWTFLVEMV